MKQEQCDHPKEFTRMIERSFIIKTRAMGISTLPPVTTTKLCEWCLKCKNWLDEGVNK